MVKLFFQHDMAYEKYKDSTKRTESDKVSSNKAFKIASDPICNRYERGFASLIYKFFDKRFKSSGIKSMSNQQLAEELHKLFNRIFFLKNAYSSFKDNVWGVYLADIQFISKYNKGIRFLLCVNDLFSENAWVVALKY